MNESPESRDAELARLLVEADAAGDLQQRVLLGAAAVADPREHGSVEVGVPGDQATQPTEGTVAPRHPVPPADEIAFSGHAAVSSCCRPSKALCDTA